MQISKGNIAYSEKLFKNKEISELWFLLSQRLKYDW